MTSHTEEFIEDPITISRKEYNDLLDQLHWLQCLENAGVDNWSGWDYALEEYNSTK